MKIKIILTPCIEELKDLGTIYLETFYIPFIKELRMINDFMEMATFLDENKDRYIEHAKEFSEYNLVVDLTKSFNTTLFNLERSNEIWTETSKERVSGLYNS